MATAAMVELGVLAGALALDAAAVTAALAASGARRRDLAFAGGLFGVAQALMAGAGALGGAWLASVAAAWDPWVAFALLAVVGARMLVEESEEDMDAEGRPPLGMLVCPSPPASMRWPRG